MRYSIEPKERIYVKGYGFLSFVKNMGKYLSSNYGQKLLDSTEKSTTDAIKTASKGAIQKTAEATGQLNGNKIGVSKKYKKTQENEAKDEAEPPKQRYIYSEKKTTIYWWIKASIIIY